jgi:cytochrome oxidase Cu insertion factor (SCO1/SenC/PrrC family)
MKSMNRVTALFAALLAPLLCAGPAAAHDDHAAPAKGPAAQSVPAPGGTQEARAYFTDLELRSQDNQPVRFFTDAMEGKTVVINFIYTNCKDACPLITQKMLQVRDLLGDRFNKEIFYVTVTTDPLRDTPAELKKFAQKQSADMPGWLFLTGSKENIDVILKKFGSYSKNIEEHLTLLLVGNVPVKRWTKLKPDAPAQMLAERVTSVASNGPQPVPPR